MRLSNQLKTVLSVACAAMLAVLGPWAVGQEDVEVAAPAQVNAPPPSTQVPRTSPVPAKAAMTISGRGGGPLVIVHADGRIELLRGGVSPGLTPKTIALEGKSEDGSSTLEQRRTKLMEQLAGDRELRSQGQQIQPPGARDAVPEPPKPRGEAASRRPGQKSGARNERLITPPIGTAVTTPLDSTKSTVTFTNEVRPKPE